MTPLDLFPPQSHQEQSSSNIYLFISNVYINVLLCLHKNKHHLCIKLTYMFKMHNSLSLVLLLPSVDVLVSLLYSQGNYLHSPNQWGRRVTDRICHVG